MMLRKGARGTKGERGISERNPANGAKEGELIHLKKVEGLCRSEIQARQR
jgi:hypothetical protein